MGVDGDSSARRADLEAEFEEAVRSARKLRDEAEAAPTVELIVLHPGFAAADVEIRRAVSIAKAIRLAGGASEPDEEDRFVAVDEFDATRPSNLDARRLRRGA